MKSLLKNLSLLSMGLMIYSCNEKISPELQSGNSTTIPTAVAPDEYYFKVTNNSATVLNYKLHRTGAGNAAVDCKVSSSGIALSSTLYIGQSAIAHDSKTYDMSCFLEAEELSMLFNGLSFKVEASKNTCEYIGYSPYSYFDGLPGSSTATYAGVNCEDPVASINVPVDVDSRAQAMLIGATIDGVNPIDCGLMVDTSIPLGGPVLRVARPIPDDFQDYCAYDYETVGGGNSKNCDEGIISYRSVNVIDGRLDPADPMDPVAKEVFTAPHKCGGNIGQCVEGPINQIADLQGMTKGTQIYATNLNEDFTTTYTLPALMGVKGSMHDIVNYRKGLASLDLNFMDYTTGSDANWGDSNYNKSFDPILMEKYAANKNPDDTTMISAAQILTKARSQGWTNTPYAADPFLGTVSRVNPFYTFYCLDRAFEIKSRIRMVVRDWDKVFPSTSSDLELISDSYMNVNARRQDLPNNEEEIPNDPGSFNYFNDVDDWDVLVEMDRSDLGAGVYTSGDTFWTPTAGWWAPGIFPNQAD